VKKIAVAGVAFAAVGYQLAAAPLYSGIWTLSSYLTLGFVGVTLLNVSLILGVQTTPRHGHGALLSPSKPRLCDSLHDRRHDLHKLQHVYFNAPHSPVYFSAPSRGAYVNIDIAIFISALMLILSRRDITHNK
jgi:hypothetical protein